MIHCCSDAVQHAGVLIAHLEQEFYSDVCCTAGHKHKRGFCYAGVAWLP